MRKKISVLIFAVCFCLMLPLQVLAQTAEATAIGVAESNSLAIGTNSQATGGSATVDVGVGLTNNSPSSAVTGPSSAVTGPSSAEINGVTATTGGSSAELHLTQTSTGTDIPPNHPGMPAMVYQAGMLAYFGPFSAPSNMMTSYDRFFQTFPSVVRKCVHKDYIIVAEGKSEKTDITFTFHPWLLDRKIKTKDVVTKTGPNSWDIPSSFNAKDDKESIVQGISRVFSLPKAKYSPLGFLSVDAKEVGIQPEVLMDDATDFLLNDPRLNIFETKDIVAYFDPAGFSASAGNTGKVRSLSIFGGGWSLNRGGDLGGGGGIGGANGATLSAAQIGKKIWVLRIDPERGMEYELPTFIPLPDQVMAKPQPNTTLPEKAKTSGVVNNGR